MMERREEREIEKRGIRGDRERKETGREMEKGKNAKKGRSRNAVKKKKKKRK